MDIWSIPRCHHDRRRCHKKRPSPRFSTACCGSTTKLEKHAHQTIWSHSSTLFNSTMMPRTKMIAGPKWPMPFNEPLNDNTLMPNSTVHFTMQSNNFTHVFQSTTFTAREFEDGSERLETYLQALTAKLNSMKNSAPTTLLPWKPLSYALQVPDAVTENNINPVTQPSMASLKSHLSPSKTKMTCVVPELLWQWKYTWMPATILKIITTTTSNRVFPSNNEKPKHSIVQVEFL